MRLASEHELDGQLRIVHEAGEAFDLAQHEIRALVGREAPREADRQRVETERAPPLRNLIGGFTAAPPAVTRPSARKRDELRLERLVRLPQLAIVHAVDVFPTGGFRAASRPVRPEVPVVELMHLRSEP